MAEHTPGPWSYMKMDDTIVAGGIPIAFDIGDDADGILMATSPELLEALEEAVDSLIYIQRAVPEISGWGVRHERIKKAQVIIAKAKGESDA